MGGFLVLVSLTLFLLFLVLTIFPQPKFIVKTRKQSAFGMFASFLLLAVGAAMLPPVDTEASVSTPESSASAEPTAKSILASDDCLKDLEVYGEIVNVSCHIETAWDEAQFIDLAGMTSAKIGRSFKSGAIEGNGTTHINLTITTQLKDRLGNEAAGRVMTLSYPVADLKAANYDNLSFTEVLNLANDVSLQPVGYEMAEKWCLKKSGDGPAFCHKALVD